jgi:hypothetical protein
MYIISICMYLNTGAQKPPQRPHYSTPSQPPPSTRFFHLFLKNQCFGLSCHCLGTGQDTQNMPELCPIALPRPLYRTHSRVLKSDIYLWLEDASKMPYTSSFVSWTILPRLWNRPGSSRQVQTWTNSPSTRIVQGASIMLKLEGYFQCPGAPKSGPKNASLLNFQYAVKWQQTGKMCHKPDLFVGH